MKKYPIILLIFVLSLYSYFHLSILTQKPLSPTISIAEYHKQRFFSFFCDFSLDDKAYIEKIQSMIDQDYENYNIVLFIENSHKKIIDQIQFYAKKKGKCSHLDIVTINQSLPVFLQTERLISNMNKNTIIISTKQNTTISSIKFLSELNRLYAETESDTLLYSNFIRFPSFIKNKAPMNYENSPLKTLYAKNLQNIPPSMYQEKNFDLIFNEIAKNLPYIFLEHPNANYIQVR